MYRALRSIQVGNHDRYKTFVVREWLLSGYPFLRAEVNESSLQPNVILWTPPILQEFGVVDMKAKPARIYTAYCDARRHRPG